MAKNKSVNWSAYTFAKGFTLIEIAITVGVIGILATVGLTSYQRYDQQKVLEAEADQLVSSLELAKKRAIAGQKPCDDFTGNYILTWSSNLFVVTPEGCQSVFNKSLSQLVTLSSTASVTFKPHGLGATAQCVIMEHTVSGKCRKINVSQAGLITNQSESDCACP